MADWAAFQQAVVAGIKAAAIGELASFCEEMITDAQAFADQTRRDIQTWTAQYAVGKITREDLRSNMDDEAQLAELAAMTKAGALEAEVQRFRSTLVKIVVDAAVKVLL